MPNLHRGRRAPVHRFGMWMFDLRNCQLKQNTYPSEVRVQPTWESADNNNNKKLISLAPYAQIVVATYTDRGREVHVVKEVVLQILQSAVE